MTTAQQPGERPWHATTWLVWAIAATASLQIAPSPLYVAIVVAVATLVVGGIALAAFGIGRLSDGLGKRKLLLVLSTMAFSLCSFLTGLASSFALLLVLGGAGLAALWFNRIP